MNETGFSRTSKKSDNDVLKMGQSGIGYDALAMGDDDEERIYPPLLSLNE